MMDGFSIRNEELIDLLINFNNSLFVKFIIFSVIIVTRILLIRQDDIKSRGDRYQDQV